MMRFEGKVALVTGGSSGIGRAAAVEFAREGARVVIAARRVEESRLVVEEIEAFGGEAIHVATDVSKAEDCKRMVDEAMARFGRLDVAFNNAGIGRSGHPVQDEELEAWLSVLSVNLTGTFLSMKYEVPALLASGGGAIVNTSSVGGMAGRAGSCSYSASKGGIQSMTKSVARELAQSNIRVNAICPGATHSEMMSRYFARVPEGEALTLQSNPMGRIAEAQEVARAALFLASDDAAFMTGQLMSVDGGAVI